MWSCFLKGIHTCAMGLMLFTSWREGATVATVGSWIWFVATKLKPRNNWCVFALGGMPGESGWAKTRRYKRVLANTSAITTTGYISPINGLTSFYLSTHLLIYQYVMHACMLLFFYLPVGVLEVNSGSKWKVSSGLPTVGLNGGLISFLNNFYRKQQQRSVSALSSNSWFNHKTTRDLVQIYNTT